MPPHSRPRSGREESPHRKPFSAAPSPRSKFTFPAVNTPVLRRSRHNSENQPPENALNVKANSPFSDTNLSPAPPPSKSTSAKGKHHGSLSLPPRPPPPRPSPSTNSARNGHDSQGNVKRKLILEPPASAEASTTCPPAHEQQDTGVKVIIRMRPCNQKEELEEATQIVEMVSSDSLCMADQQFTFDYVAGTDSSQQTMFEMVGQPLVENCLQGFNSSIFAYGQTGSGKTYTMWGATQDLLDQPPGEERGLTPRVFECLFQRIKEEEKKNADKQLRYQCRCSFLEIYNEQITDLLEPQQKTLQVREDTKIGVYVENLTEEFVSNVEDVFRLMLRGLGNRKVASTSMNLESSRSHTLFTCVIESRCKSMSDGVSSVRTSRMNLVDLAGSERQKLTGAAGERLKEAGNINRSLSQLGNLINILAEVSQTGKPRHIPYRDSRLTFLLQESLGGNAKLAMICAISPASSCKSETLSTLRFAQRAKSIQNKAVVNEETEDDVKLLREQIRQLKDELMRMKSNETLSGAVGSYSTSWNARRSYNLLRMSLSRPMTLPHTDTDTDEEMEIDEEAVECVDAVNSSVRSDDFIREDLEFSITKKGLLNDDSSRHAFDAGRHLNSSLVDADTVLVLAKSPDKHASETASYQTEFINHGDAREEGQVGKEGLHEEVNPGVLLAKESSFQCQLQTQAEDVKIDLNDCGTVNVDLCNCLEELHATPLQEIRGPDSQPQNNNLDMSTFEEPTLILQDSLDLGTECTNHETPDFLEVMHGFASTNSSDSVSQIQAENGGVSVVTESGLVLQDSLNIEPECINDDLTSLSDGNNVGATSSELSLVKQDVCRSSLEMEESVNTSADKNMFQEHESAPVSVNLLDFLEVMHGFASTNNSDTVSQIQAENGGVSVVTESGLVLQDSLNIEPECINDNLTSLSDDSKVGTISSELSPVKQDVCRNSLQMEESVNTSADENIFKGHESAPVSVNLLTSLNDSAIVKKSVADHDNKYTTLCPLEGFVEVKVDSSDPWVAADAKHDFSEGEAHRHELIIESDSIKGDPVNCTDCSDARTPESKHVLQSPILSVSPHLAMEALDAPILSVSPRLQDDSKRSFGTSVPPVLFEDTSMQACQLEHADSQDAEAEVGLQGNYDGEKTQRKPLPVRSSLRSSKNLSSPTDRLAASLHRGLQILENHQKRVSNTRMSLAQFSFQNSEWDKPKPSSVVSKSVQTSPVCFPEKALVHVPEPVHSEAMKNNDLSNYQACERLAMEEPITPPQRGSKSNNSEAILAGALRRERAMEETLNRKIAEIEQLNRLVRQYKHERECNALLQQSREDKIARLESLMDGTLPTDAFLNEEWSSLVNEHKILQERYDHHPEVTLGNIRQQRLCEDLEQYRSFCELGERDALLGEVSQLRNQLQYYVELDAPRSTKQRRRSLTPQAKFSAADANGEGTSPLDAPEFLDNTNVVADSGECKTCEEERVQWAERENEWMSVLEELRIEVEEYKQLAEKRKHEVEGQQRCADEMKEALQMAMEGHARLLDQYAELQEKHISLLARHRKIRDAMSEARKKAGKMGFLGGKWYEAQAAELIAVKFEQEQERKAAKEQIEGLQAQVRDIADAVQAAGELLVRLKEAEESVLIAQDAAALAEQDVDKLYRDMDKLKRRHSTEIATLQQRLLEARFQKSTVCPMCVMAERVKFEFTGVDEEEAEAAMEAQHLAAEAAKEVAASYGSFQMFRGELPEEPYDDENEEFYIQGMDDLRASEMDERWHEEVQKCNF